MAFEIIDDIFYDTRNTVVPSGTSLVVPLTRMFDTQMAKIISVSVANQVTALAKADLGIYRGVTVDKIETLILTTIGDVYLFNWSGYIKHPMFLSIELTDCVAGDRIDIVVHGISYK